VCDEKAKQILLRTLKNAICSPKELQKILAYFRGNGANPAQQERFSFLLAKDPITQKAKTNLGILTIS
jgi:hypothetical protein